MSRHFKKKIGWGEFCDKNVHKYELVNNIAKPKIDILNSPHTNTLQNSNYIAINSDGDHLSKIWKSLEKMDN